MSSASAPISRERRLVESMLDRMAVRRDGVLLVHSSFRQFGLDGYDAGAMVEALAAAMKGGTLLLPTMSWRFANSKHPFFDELETPSNAGVMTEIFRTRHASHRSLHPSHSLAGVGVRAGEMLASHHLDDTPCSARSPFGMLAGNEAAVALMGIGMDCCTLIHHVEEAVAIDRYLKPPAEAVVYACRDRGGRAHTVRVRHHKFLPRDYWQFQDMLAERRLLATFRAGNSACVGFRAADMVRVVRETLQARPDAIIAADGQRYRLM